MAQKQCPDCKMMIDKDAKVCPHCRERLGTSTGVKILAVILILMLFGFISSLSHQPSPKIYTQEQKNAAQDYRKINYGFRVGKRNEARRQPANSLCELSLLGF